MMSNKMFMFHYQPNQNTGCCWYEKAAEEIIESSSKWATILLAPSLPLGYPADYTGLTFGELPRVYPRVTGFKNAVSLNPGVTRDSRVTSGLPLDSKTGHKNDVKLPAVKEVAQHTARVSMFLNVPHSGRLRVKFISNDLKLMKRPITKPHTTRLQNTILCDKKWQPASLI